MYMGGGGGVIPRALNIGTDISERSDSRLGRLTTEHRALDPTG
jgi:hypothetical protein